MAADSVAVVRYKFHYFARPISVLCGMREQRDSLLLRRPKLNRTCEERIQCSVLMRANGETGRGMGTSIAGDGTHTHKKKVSEALRNEVMYSNK